MPTIPQPELTSELAAKRLNALWDMVCFLSAGRKAMLDEQALIGVT